MGDLHGGGVRLKKSLDVGESRTSIFKVPSRPRLPLYGGQRTTSGPPDPLVVRQSCHSSVTTVPDPTCLDTTYTSTDNPSKIRTSCSSRIWTPEESKVKSLIVRVSGPSVRPGDILPDTNPFLTRGAVRGFRNLLRVPDSRDVE